MIIKYGTKAVNRSKMSHFKLPNVNLTRCRSNRVKSQKIKNIY